MPSPPRSVVVNDGTPRVGDVIGGKFEVMRVLGAGGMGVVVAVKHLQLRELYAMKFLLPEALEKAETVERFLREARAAVRIKSEHVARVADVGQMPDGVPYLLMEYLEGRDLASLVEEGALPVADAVDYVLQACAGIAEAHAMGIIHRDLKPSNLFLTRRSDGAPLVKVLDFGIAKALAADEDAPSLTATQHVFGTPAYMSPEQIRSAKKVDFRTDVWSLGVILYELLTRKLPFHAESTVGILAAIAADEPTPIRTVRTDVPPELEAVVMHCLAKKRDQRFSSIAELATALAPLTERTTASVNRIRRLDTTTSNRSLAPTAKATSQPELAPTVAAVRDPGAKGASPLLFIALGATALAVAAIAIVIFLMMQRAPAPAPPPVVATADTPKPSDTPATTAGAPPAATTSALVAAPAPTVGTKTPRPHPTSTMHSATPMPAPEPAPAPAPKTDPSADSH